MNAPLLISGPSGIGKSYLARHLALNYTCQRIVPITTRDMRPGEVDGRDYRFLTDKEYLGLRSSGELFMDNEFFGAKYGYSWESVTSIRSRGYLPVTEVYVTKVPQFRQAFPDSRAIFLLPDSEQLLVDRMRSRGETPNKLAERIVEGRKELSLYHQGYWWEYQRSYFVTEGNFKGMVDDIVTTFMPEGRIVLEGPRYAFGR